MSILRYEQTAGFGPSHNLPSAAVAVAILLGILLVTVTVGLISAIVVMSSDTEGIKIVALTMLGGLPFACQGATLGWVIRPMWQRCQHNCSVGAAAALGLGLLVFAFWLTLELSMLWSAVTPVSLN